MFRHLEHVETFVSYREVLFNWLVLPTSELLELLLHVNMAQIFIVVHIDGHPARVDPLLLPHRRWNG